MSRAADATVGETRKGVAEKPDIRSVTSTSAVENIERQNLETGNPAGSAVPRQLRSIRARTCAMCAAVHCWRYPRR